MRRWVVLIACLAIACVAGSAALAKQPKQCPEPDRSYSLMDIQLKHKQFVGCAVEVQANFLLPPNDEQQAAYSRNIPADYFMRKVMFLVADLEMGGDVMVPAFFSRKGWRKLPPMQAGQRIQLSATVFERRIEGTRLLYLDVAEIQTKVTRRAPRSRGPAPPVRAEK